MCDNGSNQSYFFVDWYCLCYQNTSWKEYPRMSWPRGRQVIWIWSMYNCDFHNVFVLEVKIEKFSNTRCNHIQKISDRYWNVNYLILYLIFNFLLKEEHDLGCNSFNQNSDGTVTDSEYEVISILQWGKIEAVYGV